jgi:hypothetical protein
MDKYTELMQLSPDEAKQLIQAQGKDVYINTRVLRLMRFISF